MNTLSCAIFAKKNGELRHLSKEMKAAWSIAQRAEIASRILGVIKPLLSCPSYRSEDESCHSCQKITEIRRQTVELIQRAGILFAD